MNSLLHSILLSFIAGLSTILGSIFIFLNIKKKDEFICFCMSLSLSVMILISIFDLIPESIKLLSSTSFITYIFYLVIFFILGFIIVKLFSCLIEKEKGSNLYKIGILSFLALMLHNLPEGILTFMSASYNLKLGIKVCFAIAMHNIPEGIAIAVPIYYSTKNRLKALKITFLSSLAEPLGALITYLFLKDMITKSGVGITLIIVSGIMITLSIEELLPEAKKYNKEIYIIKGIIIGLIISLISIFI